MEAISPPNSKPSMYLENMEEVEKTFNRFDANGDGKISTEELSGVMKAVTSETTTEEVGHMMQEMDTDKDGFVNLHEFASFCKGETDPFPATSDGGEKELKEAFELYDQNHNALISASELHVMLTRLGERCSVKDCARMIKSVDSDGDGYVNFAEFKKMMTNNSNNHPEPN
ncbi:putative calcium-binding protein CML27 [Forsythia ovata]|uniref:Calcium-binding protein CML27 n=1 Tax=Forsythia ovata TaxID=205694 RepID=A0ABD1PGF7_9LAMI